MVAPLKLKRQKSPSKKITLSSNNELGSSLVEVLVETPVSFLEQIYTYRVPADLAETAVIGSLVKVEYGHTVTKGVILCFVTDKESRKHKDVLAVIGDAGMIDELQLAHFQRVRGRFGGNLWSLLNTHLPPIPAKPKRIIQPYTSYVPRKVTGQEMQFIKKEDYEKVASDLSLKCAISPPAGVDKFKILVELAKIRFNLGSVLILVSDFREFDYFKEHLADEFKSLFVALDTRADRNTRYQSFLAANGGQQVVILANRSGAFTRLPPDSTIIVVNDNDPSHYEQRSPGWNTRDVTLLRSTGISLFFLNSYHSLEINRLISIGWMERLTLPENNKCNVHNIDSAASYISLIKRGVKTGNVLVSVAEKGYANVFLCSKCKNMARCNCGGKLRIEKQNAPPSCYLCAKVANQWRCDHCGSASPFVIGRGIDRTAEEIGKAVPGIKVMTSKKDQVALIDPTQNQIVIATRGSEPFALYSAVILLDCERIYNQATLRAEEEAKHLWFDLLSRVKDGGDYYLSLPNNHPATQQVLRKQSFNMDDLLAREQSQLPPFYRTATIKGEFHELTKFAENLRDKYSFILSGPISIDQTRGYLIIRADIPSAATLVALLDDVVRVQGVKGRAIFDVRFDTYNL